MDGVTVVVSNLNDKNLHRERHGGVNAIAIISVRFFSFSSSCRDALACQQTKRRRLGYFDLFGENYPEDQVKFNLSSYGQHRTVSVDGERNAMQFIELVGGFMDRMHFTRPPVDEGEEFMRHNIIVVVQGEGMQKLPSNKLVLNRYFPFVWR